MEKGIKTLRCDVLCDITTARKVKGRVDIHKINIFDVDGTDFLPNGMARRNFFSVEWAKAKIYFKLSHITASDERRKKNKINIKRLPEI
jgi:hypothetical protein